MADSVLFKKQQSIDQSKAPIKIKQIHQAIYTWGFSKYGQTGIESCQYIVDPFHVEFDANNTKEIIQMAAGESNSAFITKDGSLYVYGKNTFGQLGNDTTKLSYAPLKIPSLKCEIVSLGGEHVLALTKDNQLYGWGLNIFGQLGLGHTENISSPAIVDRLGFLTEQDNAIFSKETLRSTTDELITEISAGPQHSMILTDKNLLYSCGFARTGALGYFSNELDPSESMIFTQIQTMQTSKVYSKIACGINHSGCIIGFSDILLWGKSEFFEFDGIERFKLFNELNHHHQPDMSLTEYRKEDIMLIDIKIGENFIVLLSSSGEVMTMGMNDNGQLGINQQGKMKMFEKVKIEEKIKRIYVGYSFVYALGVNGKVYAWGSNKYGQLLNVESEVIPIPQEIVQLNDYAPTLISCGGYHVQILSNTIGIKKENGQRQGYNYKNIPLNKAFDPLQYQKETAILNNITDLVQKELKLEMDLKEKERMIEELTLSIKEKELKAQEKALVESPKKSIITKDSNNNQLNLDKVFEDEIQFKDLTFPENNNLGIGSFGHVRKAYWRKYLVAVKSLKKDFTNQKSQANQVIPFIKEYDLLKKLRHPNILLYIGGCITGSEQFLVTEYCDNGNLFDFLHNIRSPKLTNKDRLKLALQIAKGVNYLHSFDPPILHRDLKSLNILLDKNYDVKIADFGWAKLREAHMTQRRGTFQWMAPEVIENDCYTEKADVYSFGIILWEFWSSEPPYHNVQPNKIPKMVCSDKTYRPKIPPEVPLELSNLMQQCWDENPSNRPPFLDIINTFEAYLKKIDKNIV